MKYYFGYSLHGKLESPVDHVLDAIRSLLKNGGDAEQINDSIKEKIYQVTANVCINHGKRIESRTFDVVSKEYTKSFRKFFGYAP